MQARKLAASVAHIDRSFEQAVVTLLLIEYSQSEPQITKLMQKSY